MSNPHLNHLALEQCLRTLNHLFIDITRLTYEQGYDEITGGYCELKVATLDSGIPTAKLVAAKRLRLGVRATEPKRLAFRLARELKVWAGLQHPHILPLLGFYLGDDYKSAMLISEYMDHGDLKNYIAKVKPPLDERLSLVRDLTDGLTYLHTQCVPIRHGDLKPALTDKIPFSSIQAEPQLIFALMQGKFPSNEMDYSFLPALLVDLLAKCWDLEPNDRPTAVQCLYIIDSLPFSPPPLPRQQPQVSPSVTSPENGALWNELQQRYVSQAQQLNQDIFNILDELQQPHQQEGLQLSRLGSETPLNMQQFRLSPQAAAVRQNQPDGASPDNQTTGQVPSHMSNQFAALSRTKPNTHIFGSGPNAQLQLLKQSGGSGFPGLGLVNGAGGNGGGAGGLVEALQSQNQNQNQNPLFANTPPQQREQPRQILENQHQQQQQQVLRQAQTQVHTQLRQQQQQQSQQASQQPQQQPAHLGQIQQQQPLDGRIPGLGLVGPSSRGFPAGQPPQQPQTTAQGNVPNVTDFLEQIVDLPIDAFRDHVVDLHTKMEALEDQRDRFLQVKTPQMLEQAQKTQAQIKELQDILEQLIEAYDRRRAADMGVQPPATGPSGQHSCQPRTAAAQQQQPTPASAINYPQQPSSAPLVVVQAPQANGFVENPVNRKRAPHFNGPGEGRPHFQSNNGYRRGGFRPNADSLMCAPKMTQLHLDWRDTLLRNSLSVMVVPRITCAAATAPAPSVLVKYAEVVQFLNQGADDSALLQDARPVSPQPS
ncbi:hypothetical protein FRC00_006221 [Tulasnella sp. 408]|nr:hypothetical protein FRC00_006221 [Tulasnella sp. 408]